MKAAGLDEIFNFESTEVPSSGDFWDSATVPIRDESWDEDDGMGAFQVEKEPEQKSRQQLIREKIDVSPMLSVAEIRAKFNKGTGPVFPKQVFVPKKKAGLLSVASEELAEDHPAEIKPEHETPADDAPEDSAPNAVVDQPSQLSKDEFLNIAGVHGCREAMLYFSSPKEVEIIIKPESGGARSQVLVKQMQLQFNEEQRLLVMIRKNATRYIRLNDVIRLDGRDDCLSFLNRDELPPETRKKKPIALFFTTTHFPMVIVTPDQQEKESLMKLIIFLRELLKTEKPLEICA